MQADGKETIIKQRGDTTDIINAVLGVYNESWAQCSELAKQLQGRTVEKCCINIMRFVCNNFNYKIDPHGVQWVRTPARLLKDKEADCKSYSIFVCALLTCMGIKNGFRFSSYNKKGEYTHVYSVAEDEEGNMLIIDCVAIKQGYAPFKEVKYNKIVTYMNKTQISKLSGIENAIIDMNSNENAATIYVVSLKERAIAEKKTTNEQLYKYLLNIIDNYENEKDFMLAGYCFAYFATTGVLNYETMSSKTADYIRLYGTSNAPKLDVNIDDPIFKQYYNFYVSLGELKNIKADRNSTKNEDTLNILFDNAFNFLYLFANKGINANQKQKKQNERDFLDIVLMDSQITTDAALNFIYAFCVEKFNLTPLQILSIMFPSSKIGEIIDATSIDTNKKATTSENVSDWITLAVDSFTKVWGTITGSTTKNQTAVTPLYTDINKSNDLNPLLLGAVALGTGYLLIKKNKKKGRK